MDGVDRVIGGEAVGADIAVFPFYNLGPHGQGALRGGVPELDIPHDAAHQAQVHGGDHLAVGGLDLLLDADVQLDTGPLWKLSGKLGVQTVDPLYNDHILGAQLIAPQLPLRAAQGEIIGGHRELPGGDDVQKAALDRLFIQGLDGFIVELPSRQLGRLAHPPVEIVQRDDGGVGPKGGEVIPQQMGGGGFAAAAGP